MLSIFLILFLSSCAIPFPEKEFITELWQIDSEDFTIKRLDETDNIVSIPIIDLKKEEWIVIRTEYILKEWDYQETLKRYCESYHFYEKEGN